MAKSNNNLNAVFTDTANAIRGKTGSSAPITPRDFADEINSISVGGSGDNITAQIINRTIESYNDYNGDVDNVGVFAFAWCMNLTNINLPHTSYIGSSAFYSCSNLSFVSAPDAIQIGGNAFWWCQSLEAANFPNCLQVGDSAFHNCSKISSVYLPVCRWVGARAFYNVSLLSSIELPMASFVGGQVFYYDINLGFCSLPHVANFINNGSVFSWCSMLTSVYLNPLVSNIGSCMFYGCYMLSSMDLPCLESVATAFFASCSALSSLSFIGVNNIYNEAFANCVGLSKLELYTNSVANLQNINAFQNTPMSNSSYLGYFGSIYVPAAAVASFKAATNWAAYSDRIVAFPSEYDAKNVYAYEFYNDTTITEFPASKTNVEIIGAQAFAMCSYMSGSINVPSCTFVGQWAFNNCKLITAFNGDNVKVIAQRAFVQCSSLSEISAPNCEFIGEYAFFKNSVISNINFPKVKHIEYYAFQYNNLSMNMLELPSCEFINQRAFEGSTIGNASIINLSIPNCKYLGFDAFKNKRIQSVYAPNLVYVENGAFAGCNLVGSLNFPNLISCTNQFSGCSGITEVNVPKLYTVAGDGFRGCYNLPKFLGTNVRLLGANCFYDCSALSKACVPLCTVIGERVFYKCSSLESLYLFANRVASCSDTSSVFYNTPMLDSSYLGHYGSIYVRASLLSQYQNHSIWGALSDRFVGLTDQEVQQVLDHFND